ncbi:MAG: V-type ATPase subunit [Rubrivivax sp.]|nr:V-type ATPase subunit [Rubrivivax sp.]
MKADFAPLVARARGLALHLCSREELERWAALPDPAALAHALQASGRLDAPLPAGAGAAEIEQAERRTVAGHLARLARWAGPANPVLDAFHAEQDRRCLRSLLRGAAERAPAEARLAGLLPTPRLPTGVLAELALAGSPREVALRLVVLGDPHAQALVTLTAQARVDLLEVELVLARVLAERWRRAARRGDAALRECLRTRIDLVNAQAALELAGAPSGAQAAPLFIAGGQALDRERFLAAAGAASRAAAGAVLAHAFAGTPLAALLAGAAEDPARLEAAGLAHAIATQRRRSRVDPLGSAPVQAFLARLHAQSADLRRLAWGLALGVPEAALREGLVTPWR